MKDLSERNLDCIQIIEKLEEKINGLEDNIFTLEN